MLVSLAFSENELITDEIYKKIIYDNLAINKGMIYENAISQMLVSLGQELYFYTHYSEENHRNDIEVDFILSNMSKTNLKIYPLEVKSSKNYTTSSLDSFKKRFNQRISQSFIIHPKQLSIQEDCIKIPPYFVPFFKY